MSARLSEKNPIKIKGETTPETKSEEDSLGLTENVARGLKQAPNRTEIWSRSQRPRAEAMAGPRFEQTDFDLQVSWDDAPATLARPLTFRIACVKGSYRAYPQTTSSMDT